MNLSFEKKGVLLVAFGGPEKPEEILPFLQKVTEGKKIPEDRLKEVARHYETVGGRSPLNEWTRRQAKALEEALAARDRPLPVFIGMRNWHPFLADTMKRMQEAKIGVAAGLILSAHQCESSWERYIRNVTDAMREAGASMRIDFPAAVFDHPGFVTAVADRIGEILQKYTADQRNEILLIFTAHSIPLKDPFQARYIHQLQVSCRKVAAALQHSTWKLAYQSRTGRPSDPWLEPDVHEALRTAAGRDFRAVVVVPIGFLCDHVEVLYDLDIEAATTAKETKFHFHRAGTVGDHPRFIDALADRALEVLD